MGSHSGGPWKGSSKGPTFRVGQVIVLMTISAALAALITWATLTVPNAVTWQTAVVRLETRAQQTTLPRALAAGAGAAALATAAAADGAVSGAAGAAGAAAGEAAAEEPAAAAAESTDIAAAVVVSGAQPAQAATEAIPAAAAAATEPAAAAATVPAATAAATVPAAAAAPALCLDTCYKAKDGVCDEGRGGNLTLEAPGATNWVYCDLGTDCSDCGAWQGVAHGSAWKEPVGPIEWLRENEIEVRVTRTRVQPYMYFAYTDPKMDDDESAHLHQAQMIEGTITSTFYQALQGRCDPDAPGTKGLVVDVGGNFGWFSTFSALLGCRVMSFEPVPRFRAFFEYSASRNGVRQQIQLFPNVVAADTSREYSMMVPSVGQWGATRVGDLPGEKSEIKVRAVRLDDVVGDQSVDLLKVDVEGFEPIVLSTAIQTLKRTDNIILEYAPGYYRLKRDQLVMLPTMLLTLLEAGFSLYHIPWGITFINPREPLGYAAPLPAMETISRRHVEYDLWSAERIRNGSLPGQGNPAAYPCPELAAANIAVPYHVDNFWYTHPKGLHAAVVFNTNILGTKNSSWVKAGPALNARIWPLEEPASGRWFSKDPEWGMGYVYCRDQPAEYKVALRCRCTDPAVCGAHQAAAEACEAEKLTGYID